MCFFVEREREGWMDNSEHTVSCCTKSNCTETTTDTHFWNILAPFPSTENQHPPSAQRIQRSSVAYPHLVLPLSPSVSPAGPPSPRASRSSIPRTYATASCDVHSRGMRTAQSPSARRAGTVAGALWYRYRCPPWCRMVQVG